MFCPLVHVLLLLLSRLSRVRLCATPQTAAHQAPPSMGFSRQEYWSGVPLPSPHAMRCSQKFSSAQLLSHVQLFVTPRTAAHQASLSITNSQSLLKLMSIESVMPSNYLILCHPLLLPPSIFPVSGSFQMSQVFASGGQSIGVSASTSVLPMNTQD